jgi:hypothetical protein
MVAESINFWFSWSLGEEGPPHEGDLLTLTVGASTLLSLIVGRHADCLVFSRRSAFDQRRPARASDVQLPPSPPQTPPNRSRIRGTATDPLVSAHRLVDSNEQMNVRRSDARNPVVCVRGLWCIKGFSRAVSPLSLIPSRPSWRIFRHISPESSLPISFSESFSLAFNTKLAPP